MLCKYYLQIGSVKVDIHSENCIEVGTMVANLSELAVSYKRTGYNGVVRSCGSDIVFVGEAYSRLMSLWQTKYYKSQASFAVYVINDLWMYEKLWECPLDFSTFRYDSYRVTIGCVDKGAAALIRANQGTRYHYGAVGLSESLPLGYDRVQVQNKVEMTVNTGSTYEGFDRKFSYFDVEDERNVRCVSMPVYVSNSDGVAEGQGVLALSHDEQLVLNDRYPATIGDHYFAEAVADGSVVVDLTSVKVRVQHQGAQIQFMLSKGTGITGPTELVDGVSVGDGWYEFACHIRVSLSVSAGDKIGLQMYFWFDGYRTTFPDKKYLMRGSCVMDWVSRGKDIDMRVIRPVTLLNKLLRSIGGENSQIRGEIDDAENERLRNTMLLPAEEIRGFSGPTLYSSFKQFCEFMEAVFGYTYEIEEDAEVRETVTDALEIVPIDGRISTHVNTYPGTDALEVDSVWYIEEEARFCGLVTFVDGYFRTFVGSDAYNNAADNNHAYQNKIYYDKSTCEAFKYVPTTEVSDSAAVALTPYVLDEICSGYYDYIMRFAGFEDDIDADHGEYLGQVEDEDVWFVRNRGKFFCKMSGQWYSVWDGASYYNTSDGLRAKSIFKVVDDDSGVYVAAQGKYLLFHDVDVDEVDPLPCASVVRFKHREKVFSNEVSMELERVSGPVVSVAKDRLYSELRIGYEKQDYDLGNSGNDEWNFTNRYATDVQLSAKTLELISPYRADCYGIEEAAGKRGQETSSSESDGDLWMVKVLEEPVGGRYVIDRSITVVGSYTDTVFNATYAPMYCIYANKAYLGSFAQRYTFASCEGNRNIRFDDGNDNIGMSRSFVFNSKLFRIEDIEVETDDQMLPLDFSGLVEFAWGETIYRGFVNSVEFNPQRPEVVKYELIFRVCI